jgi:hypothetical protein
MAEYETVYVFDKIASNICVRVCVLAVARSFSIDITVFFAYASIYLLGFIDGWSRDAKHTGTLSSLERTNRTAVKALHS